MIKLRNLTKLFGPRQTQALTMLGQGATRADILTATGCTLALNDVSLDIPSGQTTVLMGLSGSGKSTLIRHINRLIEPTSGDIHIDDTDIRALDAKALRDFRRTRISMVFQGFGLLPHLNVRDNVAFGLIARGEKPGTAHPKTLDWIKTVDLDGYELAFPDTLSGGMKQRVGLARALAVDTEILLMDEAFSALDPLTRADMQDLLRDLQSRLTKTIVFVTHDLDEALRLGDCIAILKDGAIVQTGTPDDILNHPVDDYVARFVNIRRRN